MTGSAQALLGIPSWLKPSSWISLPRWEAWPSGHGLVRITFGAGHSAGTKQCLQCCRRGPWTLQLQHFSHGQFGVPLPSAEEAKRKAMTMADATAGVSHCGPVEFSITVSQSLRLQSGQRRCSGFGHFL